MLEKEEKEDAIQKFMSRKEKTTTIIPPTCSGMNNFMLYTLKYNNPFFKHSFSFCPLVVAELNQNSSAPEGRRRKAPCCQKCKKPMKGHKRGQC